MRRACRRCALLFALALLSGAAAPAGAQDRPHLSGDPEANRARALIRAGEPRGRAVDPASAGGGGGRAPGPHRHPVPYRPRRDGRGRASGAGGGKPRPPCSTRPSPPSGPSWWSAPASCGRGSNWPAPSSSSARTGWRASISSGCWRARPPPAVAASIRGFLEEMRARRRWSAHFGMALASDSNPGAASADDTVHISLFGQTLPFRVGEDAGPKPGLGVAAWGGGRIPPSAERAHEAQARRRFLAAGTRAQGVRPHRALGPCRAALAGGRRTPSSPCSPARAGTWPPASPHSRETGLRLEAAHRLSQRLTAQAEASWHRRAHARAAGHRRVIDGPQAEASLAAAWLATPQLRFDALAGWARERTRSGTVAQRKPPGAARRLRRPSARLHPGRRGRVAPHGL